ncbi:MAG: BON domain-containing protein [Acidobacteriaceae bacterium]|nr:BON domain-containing protein [Acidobacteriaceae bacterium]
MSTYCNDSKLVRTALLGLLAGCLWFSAATAGLAQEGQDNAGQDSARSPQTSAQQTRTDADIQSEVRSAIAHDSELQGQHITCVTADGIVNLSGTVQTNAQFQRAETVASNVPGVSGIVNNIKVGHPNSPEPPPPDQAAANTVDPNAAASQIPPPPPDEPGTQAPAQASPNQAPPPPANNGTRVPYQPGYYPTPQQSYGTQAAPTGPVTIPAGTLVRVRLSETLDTARVKSGTYFQATAAYDVYQGGVLAIPRGAVLQGQVVQARNAGELGGSAELQLELTGINLEGTVYPISTDLWSNRGPSKAGYTAGNTIGGATLGAIIGGIAGGGAGAAIGAGVGGVAGLGVSSATSGPRIMLPAESLVDFHLAAPVTVQPVSWQEARRLAASAPQEPRLVPRPYRPAPMYAPYPYPYYPYPYPYYAYPYPYYRR